MNPAIDIPRALQPLAEDGFVHLPGLCGETFLHPVLDVAHARIREVRAALGDRDIGIGSKAGFDEIVQRSPGRWDLPIPPRQFGVDDHDTPWWPIIAAVLRLRGTGGTPPREGGWRELRGPELR